MELFYILSKKVFLIFQEIEFFGPKIKNFLIFFQKKAFLIFQEMELSSPKNIKRAHSGKISYILVNRNF